MNAVEPSRPRESRSRIVRGWRITRASWRLIRRDPAMLSLALLGMLSALLASGLVFFLGGYLSPGDESRLPPALVGLLAAYPCIFVATFFNVALAAAASASLDGESMPVGEALRMARGKIGPIALWSLVAGVVGVILSEIAERLPGGSALVSRLFGLAWALATFFVVPILAIEGARPIAAISRSAGLMKSRWGEGLTGSIAIGAWAVLITIPGVMLVIFGLSAAETDPGAGIPLLVAGVTAVIIATGYATAARQVFAVALYRHAIDAPAGGFATWDLEHPFDPPKERRGRKALRIAGLIVAGLVAVSIVAALLAPDRRSGTPGEFNLVYGAQYAPYFREGMPVVHADRRIGAVVTTELEGERVVVYFRVRPRYRPLITTSRASVTSWHGRSAIRIARLPGDARGPGSRS